VNEVAAMRLPIKGINPRFGMSQASQWAVISQAMTQPLENMPRKNTESDPGSLRADFCVSLWFLRPGT